MTRIDFHTNVADRLLYTCRLVRKARAAHCNVVILVKDRAELMALDQSLWTFSQLDFLPHVLAGEPYAAETPIILTDRDDAALPHHHVLVNLSSRTPEHFARFERMLEIVSSDPAETVAGRERYRFYQQRGYPLSHHIAEPA